MEIIQKHHNSIVDRASVVYFPSRKKENNMTEVKEVATDLRNYAPYKAAKENL